MENQMKTFESLNFKQRRNPYNGQFEEGMRAVEKVATNISVSVLLGGKGMYSNGIDTYELAIIYYNKIVYVWSDDVYAYIGKEKVTEIMLHLQNLTDDEIELFEENYLNEVRKLEEQQRWAEEYYSYLQSIGVV